MSNEMRFKVVDESSKMMDSSLSSGFNRLGPIQTARLVAVMEWMSEYSAIF